MRSRPCDESWHKYLRGWSAVADRGMRANRVVMPSPAFDDDLCFAQRVEDLAVEQLVAQAGIGAFDEAVLPRAAGGDVGRLRADRGDPLLHRLGDKFRPIVGTNMPRDTAQNEQVGEQVDDVDRFDPTGDPNGQALMGELVDDIEQPDFAPVMGALLDKIVRPDVIGALGVSGISCAAGRFNIIRPSPL